MTTEWPEILTIVEVAEIFRVTPVTIRRWTKTSREGKSCFPKPIGAKFQHLRWSKDAIFEYFLHGEKLPVENQSDRHVAAMESLRKRGVAK